MLLTLLTPARIVAIGNDAAEVVSRIAGRIPVMQVRHPSYGGQRQFERQVADLYGIEISTTGLFKTPSVARRAGEGN
jgi:hypothetical protein